jgi:hypothetical protein
MHVAAMGEEMRAVHADVAALRGDMFAILDTLTQPAQPLQKKNNGDDRQYDLLA